MEYIKATMQKYFYSCMAAFLLAQMYAFIFVGFILTYSLLYRRHRANTWLPKTKEAATQINAQDTERERPAGCISDWTGAPAKYCGARTFNYEVGCFTVGWDGSLTFDAHTEREVVGQLFEHIYDDGFNIDQSHTDGRR